MTALLQLGSMDGRVLAALAGEFDILQSTPEDIDEIIAAHSARVRGILTRGRSPTTAALIARLPALELIANFGVGYDSIDLAAAAAAGVIVTNTPDVLNDEMGDFTIGLLLATIRQLPQAECFLRDGRWVQGEAPPLTASLRGRHVGIAGLGRIGRVIARRLSGFDVPVSAFVRRRPEDLDMPTHDNLIALARAVDVLIVVLPGGDATRHMIDAPVLEALGPNGVLINVARGSVVDEPALIEALQQGKIAAAGLDVFADEPQVPAALMKMNNVVLLPHIGTATHHTRGLMGDVVIANVRSWFVGNGPITPVPETPYKKLPA
jgi:lactate dehydrogenase-like 2-hydroxyacid dehydrogenase